MASTEEKSHTLFDFQLEMLKAEVNYIQNCIGRIDDITQQIKNWAILVWAGSISLLIGNQNTDFRKFIIVSTIIPLLFWTIDGYFRRRQRRFLFRNKKIAEYLNSDDFEESFIQKKLKNFTLLDLIGKQYPRPELHAFSNVRRAMWFKSMRTFYLGIIIATILLQIILYPYVTPQIINKTFSEQKDSILITNQTKTIEILLQMLKRDSLYSKTH